MGIGEGLLGICILLAVFWLWIVTGPRKVSTMDGNAETPQIVQGSFGKSFAGGLLAVVVVLGVLFGLAFAIAGWTP